MFISSLLISKCPKDKIFKDIDHKLSQLAKSKLEEIKYRVKNCDNTDIEFLSDLRDILMAKQNGAECFRNYSESDIIKVIKTFI